MVFRLYNDGAPLTLPVCVSLTGTGRTQSLGIPGTGVYSGTRNGTESMQESEGNRGKGSRAMSAELLRKSDAGEGTAMLAHLNGTVDKGWIVTEAKYCDLTANCSLVVTVWEGNNRAGGAGMNEVREFNQTPIGGTSIRLFNRHGALRFGQQKLFIWKGVGGDGAVNSSTPHKIKPDVGIDKITKIIQRYDQNELPRVKWLDKLSFRRIEKMNQATPEDEDMYLVIDLPNFRRPVIFDQLPCNRLLPLITPFMSAKDSLDALHKPVGRLFAFFDPEMDRPNPVESKYLKLDWSTKKSSLRDLKPSIAEKRQLQAIIASPNRHLAGFDKALLLRFRYSLTDNKRALNKFARCVDWADLSEANSALELFDQWAPIDVADALELLSAHFTNPGVRSYAVKQIGRAEDEEFQCYLLQLVQALKYEKSYPSPLSVFLLQHSCHSFKLANYFHWYVRVEMEDAMFSSLFKVLHNDFLTELNKKHQGVIWATNISRQEALIQNLVQLSASAKVGNPKVAKMIENMRELLSVNGKFKNLRQFAHSVSLPVNPDLAVTGIIGEEAIMFKSALAPMCLPFISTDLNHNPYRVIFKSGDDLRQDQLVIGLISLMDQLLKKVNLDLRLTPYRVLATSSKEGFVEFVQESHTLTSILEKYGNDIRKFLEHYNPKPSDLQQTLENFVRSCAGYCVITYLLGIGDRHLENVLLTTSGHLFHIDFGYILGRDPKPFPPPMKLSREMVEAMGGSQSNQYKSFEQLCCQCFNILRKSSNLILNLFMLMLDSGVTDLRGDGEKILLKIQDKFRLDLSDEEAEAFFLQLIAESVSALFPQMMERIHGWALYWR